MEPIKRKDHDPEAVIQAAIKRMLERAGWYVLVTVGSAFQAGFPDLYATHRLFRARWIEVKLPGMRGSKFTPAQLNVFPELIKNGAGVWILTAATDAEYQKLFQKYNFGQYVTIVLARGDRVK